MTKCLPPRHPINYRLIRSVGTVASHRGTPLRSCPERFRNFEASRGHWLIVEANFLLRRVIPSSFLVSYHRFAHPYRVNRPKCIVLRNCFVANISRERPVISFFNITALSWKSIFSTITDISLVLYKYIFIWDTSNYNNLSFSHKFLSYFLFYCTRR